MTQHWTVKKRQERLQNLYAYIEEYCQKTGQPIRREEIYANFLLSHSQKRIDQDLIDLAAIGKIKFVEPGQRVAIFISEPVGEKPVAEQNK